MAKSVAGPYPVIEWSTGSMRLYDPASRRVETVSPGQAESILAGRPVIVAISRRAAFVRTTRLPDAAKIEVARILQLQIDKLFPIGSSKAAIDFVQTEDRNSEGRLAIVAATSSENLERIKTELRSLNIVRIVPAALGSIPLASDLGQGRVAVVQDSPEGLAIDLIEDGLLKASRVVPQPDSASEIVSEVHRSWAMAKIEPGRIAAAGGLVFDGAELTTPMSSLAAMSVEPPELDLEDPNTIAMREMRKVNRARSIAIAAWLAAASCVAALVYFRMSDMKAVESAEKGWLNKTRALRVSTDRARGEATKLGAQATTLVSAFEPKQYIGDLAVIYASVAPKGLWLTGMNIERGKTSTVRGVAMTHEAVSSYLESLASTDRFRDIKLNFMNDGEIEESPVVNFSVSMHIIGNFPLNEDLPKSSGKAPKATTAGATK